MSKEVRYYADKKIELRDDGQTDQRKIIGYGVVFNQESRVMTTPRGERFIEIIRPESVDGLLEDTEIRAYLNHDINLVLGRNKRTMTLTKDEYGVKYEITPPNSPNGQNAVEAVTRGDIDTSSFAFSVAEDGEKITRRKNDGILVREITKMARIYDMSPVTSEAYEGTTANYRSIEEFTKNSDEKRRLINQQKKERQKLLRNLKLKSI